MKTILPVALAVLRPVTLAKITLLPVKAAKRTTTLVKTFALPALQGHFHCLKTLKLLAPHKSALFDVKLVTAQIQPVSLAMQAII